ncbi:MAG: hypothetical protein UT48_C0006G0033 [Parcubacteria group bacterium GW2011_GWE2_39_37]|uniref:DUF8173 domain-containing protein n=1 Tax=Candidatus Falkowbacteria bacterium GW2011_GWF2_39_8 TaxID=1618642 RepID=A0A0G0Q0M0_9BACT|nr:MAG: hypothetical protein UT48_C0006G0033 [Parcubacteria group bacterium GW2011_GWE2_39_37]KKR33894.1 MAG: hypothetical protein UT64_C0002G0033 [Candidatus Falkowbacteria bacterium GW2011_GWF2_39_8]
MTKTSKLLLAIFALLLLPLGASALTAKSGENIAVNQDQTIDDNYYAAGSNLNIDGKITGDLICAGQSINVNGEVGGDVICAGQSININGKVVGSVRVLTNALSVNGSIGKNLTVAAASINTNDNSTIGGEMLMAAAATNIKGKISGDLTGAGSVINLNGEIGKNVKLWIDDKKTNQPGLTISNNAQVGGSLLYTANKDARFEGEGSIGGEVKRNEWKENYQKESPIDWLWGVIFSIFASIIGGLVLIGLFRDQVREITDEMLEHFGPALGWGLIILFLTPLVALVLMITLIGIPLALTLMALWLIMIWISKIIVGILIGRVILEKLFANQKSNMMLALILGVILTRFIFAIPVLGWLLCFFAILWGLGGIFLFFKRS